MRQSIEGGGALLQLVPMESEAALAARSCNAWPNGSQPFPRATGRSCDSPQPALHIADLHCHAPDDGESGPSQESARAAMTPCLLSARGERGRSRRRKARAIMNGGVALGA